jgi:heme/copper-type cytochrome/quinol oxidase subunit 4
MEEKQAKKGKSNFGRNIEFFTTIFLSMIVFIFTIVLLVNNSKTFTEFQIVVISSLCVILQIIILIIFMTFCKLQYHELMSKI